MTTRAPIARHRAEVSKTSSISVIAKAVSSNAGGMGRQAAVIAAASGLVLTTGIAANAAEPTMTRVSDASSTLNVKAEAAQTVTADSTVKLAFARTVNASTPAPAPVVEAPVVAQATTEVPIGNAAVANTRTAPATNAVALAAAPAVAPAPAPAPAAAPAPAPAAAPAPAPAAAPAPAPVAPAPTPPAAPAVASGVGATIAAAAYAQLGVHQDCTALASNALAAAGIFYHGWPAGYMSLGRTVSAGEAQPGDLIYYDNAGAGVPHIAVYVGNGQAVHGGFNGGNTQLFSAYLGSGPVFIAIGH